MQFFEGSEKKVEIAVEAGAPSLRALGRPFWAELVSCSGAEILSQRSNEQMDAYLLSESSLFVWDDRMLMITCGTITLVDSVLFFLAHYGKAPIELVIFQRKNEYQSHLQKSSFEQDIVRLNNALDGVAFRLGHLDGHHNYVWHLDRPYHPQPDDITTELLMYHIAGEAATYLRNPQQTKSGIRQLLKFDQLLPGFDIDDFLFEPFGYSMNAIRCDQYVTMHITPQEETSYVSFETDLDIPRECPELLNHLLVILQPGSYDLITFNTEPELDSPAGTHCVARNLEPLSCGFEMRYRHFLRQNTVPNRAVKL